MSQHFATLTRIAEGNRTQTTKIWIDNASEGSSYAYYMGGIQNLHFVTQKEAEERIEAYIGCGFKKEI